MTVSFLAATAAAGTDAIARSPMAERSRAAGANFESDFGWEHVTDYGDPERERELLTSTVGFCDRSQLGKFELQGPRAELDAIEAAVPARGLSARWCQVTPTRRMLLREAADSAAARGHLDELVAASDSASNGHVGLLEITTTYAAISIAGPSARELFARFCALDLRPGSAAPGDFLPGSVARTPGFVLVEGPDRFLALFGWALGAYVFDVVADAAAHLGGGPVGSRALQSMPTPATDGEDADA